jgi:hypothetical protein
MEFPWCRRQCNIATTSIFKSTILMHFHAAANTRQKVATMDAFRRAPILDPALYYLFPVIATMDASTQKVLIIPVG